MENEGSFVETCCDYTIGRGRKLDDEIMYLSTSELRMINKILNYRDLHPNRVHVLRMPKDNDGTLYCTVPASWLKVSPPRSANWSDEQRQAAAERMKVVRAAQTEDE